MIFSENPPFVIEKAVIRGQTGGMEASGKGQMVSLFIKQSSDEELEFQRLVYGGTSRRPAVYKGEENIQIAAIFYENTSPTRSDMVMDGDSRKEVGNQPPLPLKMDEELPLELAEGEAALIFSAKNGKPQFIKFTPLRDKNARIYPGQPQN